MTINQMPQQWQTDPFHQGDRIRKAREERGYYKIKEFAAVTGIDRGTLAKYERTGRMKDSVVKVISAATGAREEWIKSAQLPMFKDDPEAPQPKSQPTDYTGVASSEPVDLRKYRAQKSRKPAHNFQESHSARITAMPQISGL